MKLKPGIKVRLVSTGEVGVVVHTWKDEIMDSIDCHVAFYGNNFPQGKPKEPPYVLRYLESSLEVIDE